MVKQPLVEEEQSPGMVVSNLTPESGLEALEGLCRDWGIQCPCWFLLTQPIPTPSTFNSEPGTSSLPSPPRPSTFNLFPWPQVTADRLNKPYLIVLPLSSLLRLPSPSEKEQEAWALTQPDLSTPPLPLDFISLAAGPLQRHWADSLLPPPSPHSPPSLLTLCASCHLTRCVFTSLSPFGFLYIGQGPAHSRCSINNVC